MLLTSNLQTKVDKDFQRRWYMKLLQIYEQSKLIVQKITVTYQGAVGFTKVFLCTLKVLITSGWATAIFWDLKLWWLTDLLPLEQQGCIVSLWKSLLTSICRLLVKSMTALWKYSMPSQRIPTFIVLFHFEYLSFFWTVPLTVKALPDKISST